MHASTLIVTASLSTVLFFAAHVGAQNPPPPDSVAVQVTSAVSGKPVAEAYVLVTGEGVSSGSTAAVSELDGWAWLPELVPQPPQGGEPVPTNVTVQVSRVGYLPVKKLIHFSDSERLLSLPIVPADVGYNTPLIRATSGGRFELVGLGTLKVAANALTQDVTLRLIPIPDWGWSNPLAVDEVMRYQIWVAAYDSAGAPAQAALPTQPGAITLDLRLPSSVVIPDGAYNQVWTTHCVGEQFAYDFTSVGQQPQRDLVVMPLGSGHNTLYQTYSVAETTCNGVAGPWTYRTVFMGVKTRIIATVPVLCGVLTATGGCSVKAGEEITSTLEWKEEDYRKYGLTGATVVGRVNVEAGTSSSYTETDSRVTTRAREGKVEKADGSTVSGRPAGQQGGGYDCVTGDCHFGEVFRRYAVWARRSWTCANGTIQSESVKVAEVEVFVGLQLWYDVHWDGSCAGCAATGTVPNLPKPR